ncbi:MAG: hypothetical protein MUO63_13420, partial [Desulfobulbaceae bacterium]|nr:hypothetical protein [Desulfobulbaceae bacterium]
MTPVKNIQLVHPGLVMEINQLNEAMADPKQCSRLLKSLFKIADAMNARKLSHNKMMDRVLHVVLDYLGVEQGSLMVLARNKLVVRAATRPEIIGHKQTLTD